MKVMSLRTKKTCGGYLCMWQGQRRRDRVLLVLPKPQNTMTHPSGWDGARGQLLITQSIPTTTNVKEVGARSSSTRAVEARGGALKRAACGGRTRGTRIQHVEGRVSRACTNVDTRVSHRTRHTQCAVYQCHCLICYSGIPNTHSQSPHL